MAEEINNKITNTLKDIDSYELMKNDKGDVMILLYATNTAPAKATFYLNKKANYIELTRNNKSVIIIEGLKNESIQEIEKLSKLYVCEIKYDEKTNTPEEEAEIVYAYIAEQSLKETRSIQEKAKEQRKKITENKDNPTA